MFGLLKSGLNKIRKAFSATKALFGDPLRQLFRSPINEETLESLEQILYEADLGTSLTSAFIKEVKRSDDPIKLMKE